MLATRSSISTGTLAWIEKDICASFFTSSLHLAAYLLGIVPSSGYESNCYVLYV
jgi:hypothetical protein